MSCSGAPAIEADAVIIACGGLSVPMTGSEGAGLRIAEKLGHTMHTDVRGAHADRRAVRRRSRTSPACRFP